MRCPSCNKKVVFGSIVGDSWRKISAGEWLHGNRPPKEGRLGECPVCGARLEWEPGERQLHDPSLAPSARVHLSAVREAPERWEGKRIGMRSLAVVIDGVGFLSDSWRSKASGDGTVESDRALIERLLREQAPKVETRFESPAVQAVFDDSARALQGIDARSAWMEFEGRLDRKGDRWVIRVDHIASIWPPRD